MLSQASTQALARLRAYKPPPTNYHKLPLTRRAAVLILLFPDRHGDLKVVLTMRAATLRSYASQAALPGGKSDFPSETPQATARREASEEIGLPATDAGLPAGYAVEHLCELPLSLAKTELGVRPCVAFLSGPRGGDGKQVEETMIPRLDPKEVAAVFVAPFAQFLKKEWDVPSAAGRASEEGPRTSKGTPHSWYRGSWNAFHGGRWRMHNFYVPKPRTSPASASYPTAQDGEALQGKEAEEEPYYRVFGMTARILVDAARIAYGAEPAFEHNDHFGDEELIGRLLGTGRLATEKVKGSVL